MIFLQNNKKSLIYLIYISILSYFISKFILGYIIESVSLTITIFSITAYEALNSIILIYFYVWVILFIPLLYRVSYKYLKDALYSKERSFVKRISWLYLFILAGAGYGYYTAIKFIIPFLFTFNTKISIDNSIGLESLIITIIRNCLLFSLVFLTPFIIKYLLDLKIIEKRLLSKNRRLIYVLLLIISAILTPPDILSMILSFIPFVCLFEIGILISKK